MVISKRIVSLFSLVQVRRRRDYPFVKGVVDRS